MGRNVSLTMMGLHCCLLLLPWLLRRRYPTLSWVALRSALHTDSSMSSDVWLCRTLHAAHILSSTVVV